MKEKTHKYVTETEVTNMRGYFTAEGFYGLVEGRYMLFANEADYYEFMKEAA